MLNTDELINNLENLPGPVEQRRFIEDVALQLTDEQVQQIKSRANDLLGQDISRALALADNILYASQVSGKAVHRALGLMVQANALRQRGQEREAIRRYDEAREAALQAGNSIEAARSQVGKVGALMQLGELHTALAVAQETGDTLLRHGETVSAALAYMNGGICYCQLGHQEKALQEYHKAQQILEEHGSEAARKTLRTVFYNISISLDDLGRFQEALDYCLQALELARQYNLAIVIAGYEQHAAHCYFRMGDYNRALRMLHNAHDIFVKNQLTHHQITGEFLIANSYLELGRFEEAAEQARRLLILMREGEYHQTSRYAHTLLCLGQALFAVDQVEEASQAVEAGRVVARQLGHASLQQRLDLLLAELLLARQQFEEAENLLQGLLDNPVDLFLYPAAQLLMARRHIQAQRYEPARTLIYQANRNFENHGLQSGLYQGYYLLAGICEQEGDPTGALDYLERSITQLEHLRGRVAAETRSAFIRTRTTVYEDAVNLALLTGRVEQAFNLAERIKSRALVELVGNQLDIRVKVRDEDDRALVEEIEQLRRQHNQLTSQLARWQYDENGQPPGDVGREAISGQVIACERRLTALTERLQIRNAHYAEDATLAPVYQPFDCNALDGDEAIVEYFVTRKELLAFVITRQGVQCVRKLATIAQLNRQLSFFRLNLAGTAKNLADAALIDPGVLASRREGLLENSRALLQKLYATLFEPVAPLVAGFSRLVIVPHGSLHYLPFHALCQAATGQYLLEQFEQISYLPSARMLPVCRQQAAQTAPSGALVAGYSNQGALPCTVEEARVVAATLDCAALVEQEATLEQFRAASVQQRIIHLAAHGVFREEAPLFSGLLLANGELSAHEIFNLEWRASLVTLSACDSGLGRVGDGDEVLGLSRACLYAGAASLLLSLWRVEDRAGSDLMQEFYANLLQGQPKALALRQAQLSLLRNPLYRHPFYWAPFILIGDSRAL